MSVYNGKVLSVKVMKFYDVVKELIPKKEYGTKTNMPIVYALSKSGIYIGTTKDAFRLVNKFGIEHFEAISEEVCSIGYCPSKKKWYGWSHRAIHGFKVGDKVKKGDCCATSGLTDEYLKEHPEESKHLPVGFTAKTSADTKRMAIAFADSVS